MKFCKCLSVVLTMSLGSGQVPGRQIIPPDSLHQYSAISPVSAAGDKLHTFNMQGAASIVKVADGTVVATNAPYPEAHWDNADDDLMYVIGQVTTAPSKIQTWRPSTRQYETFIDYTGQFTSITTGATTDITSDNWEAFWAQNEHTLCAVDLTAKKTYCADVNVADPLNHLPSVTPNVDYVAVTPRDSISGLHYVLMMATPAMGVFSVDETAGVLRWVVRPELVAPMMGVHAGQNQDGNCDPGEACLTTPHGDIFVAGDGQVYLEIQVGMENSETCQAGQGLLRLNAGLLMTKAENFQGVTGGGMKYVGPDFSCGGVQVWSDQHTGCNRWGGHCVVSFDTPTPLVGQVPVKMNQLWLIGLDPSNTITYSQIGVTSPSYVNSNTNSNLDYWSNSRAASSMDGTQVIYDSDAGSNGLHHAVYQMSTALAAAPGPVYPCSYALSSTSLRVGAPTSSGSIWITPSAADCPRVSATSNVPWAATFVDNNATDSTVLWSVTANPSSQTRNGSLTVVGQIVPIVQSGTSCSYVLSTIKLNVGAAASSGVTTFSFSPTDCGAPPITSNVPWASASIFGKKIMWSVAANPGSQARSGSLSVAGEVVFIQQSGKSGASPLMKLSPVSLLLRN
jgi:hypothetical protein